MKAPKLSLGKPCCSAMFPSKTPVVESQSMKPNQNLFTRGGTLASLAIAAILLGAAVPARADINWDGDNAAGNFSYCDNWYGDSCPSFPWNSSYGNLVFNYRNNGSQTSLYYDLGWPGSGNIGDIIWETTFGAAVPINGSGGGINFNQRVENRSSFAQTLNIPLSGAKGGATQIELNPVNGDLVLNGNIYNDNNVPFHVFGVNSKMLTIGVGLTGNASVSLNIDQYSKVKLTAAQAWGDGTHGVVINQGEFWMDSGGSLASATVPITVGQNDANVGKLWLSVATGGQSLSNPITLNNQSGSPAEKTIGGLNTSGTNTFNSSITLNGQANLSAGTGGAVIFAGPISGAQNVVVNGYGLPLSGVIQFAGTNTYTGNTYISGGTLQFNATGYASNSPNFYLGEITGSQTATLALGSVTGGQVFTNTIPVRSGSSGTKTISSLATSGNNTLAGNIALSDNLVLNSASGGNLLIGGPISSTGSFGLTNAGSGVTTVLGVNSYSGGTTFGSGGTIFITNDAALGASAGGLLFTASGALAATNYGAPLNNAVTLGATRAITVNSGVTAGFQTPDTNNLTVASYITGAGGVLKRSSSYALGTVRFSNDTNDYTGDFSVGFGTAEFTTVNNQGTASSLGKGASGTGGQIILGNGTSSGTLRYVGSAASTTTRPLNWTGTTGGYTLDASGSGSISYLATGSLRSGSGGAQQLSLAGTGSGTLSQIINDLSGATTLVKSGSGTWVLNSANTFSGGTTISGGTLRVSTVDNVLGTGAITVSGSSTLATASGGGARILTNAVTINASQTLSLDGGYANLTLNGAISGSGPLSVGNGTSILGGTSPSFTGTIGLNSGSDTLSVPGTLSSGAISMSASSQTLSVGGSLSAPSLTASYAGTISVPGTLSLAGPLTVSIAATETVSGAGTITADSVSVKNYSTVNDSLTSLIVTNNFLLGDASSQSGSFTQSAGTVKLNTSSSIGIRIGHWNGGVNTSIYTLSGGTLNAASVFNIGYDGNGSMIMSGGVANLTNGLALGTSGHGGLTNTLYFTGGQLNIGSGGITQNGAGPKTNSWGAGTIGSLAAWSSSVPAILSDASTGTTFDTTGGNITLSGILSGSGRFVKAGTGTLTLSGVNTYAGSATVNNGTVSIAADSGLGTAPGSVVANQLTLNGGTLAVTGAATLSTNRGITIGSSGATVDTSSQGTGNSTTILGALIGTGALTLKANGDMSATGGGASGLGIKLVNTGNNFITDVTITAGLVTYSADSVFGNSANKIILNGGGLLDPNLNVPLSRTIQVNAGGGTIRVWGSVTPAWSSTFTGSGNINKTDSGGLTLSGDLSGYSGTFNNQGSGSTSLTGAGASTIGGNWTISAGSLTVNSSANQALAGVIGGTGSFTKNGTGTLTVSGVNTYSGATTISGGTLTLGGAGRLNSGSYAGNITDNAAFVFNSSAAQALSGIISGTGTLTKQGAGPLTLFGVNTYGGATTVSNGELIGVTGGGCAASAVSVANGATNGVQLAAFNGQWTVAGLTCGASGGDTTCADINFGSVAPSFGNAPLQVNGNLTINGTLNIIVRGGSVWQVGTYPLIKYGGTLTGMPPASAVTLPAGVTASIVNNTANKSIDLKVTAGAVITQVNWAVGNQTWDTVTANWTNFPTGGALTTYADGYQAVLDDTASGTSPIAVTLSTLVNPTNVMVNITNKNYTLSGLGTIGGSGSLVKNGSGTLTLSTSNTYSGATVISGGILKLGTNLAFGSSATVNNTGTLDMNGQMLGGINEPVTISGTGVGGIGGSITNSSSTKAVLKNVTLAGDTTLAPAGSAAIDISSTNGQTATLNLNGFTLTKSGAGTLVLNGVNMSGAGNITVNAGTLELMDDYSSSTYPQQNTTLAGTGNLTINSGASVTTYRWGSTLTVSMPIIMNGGTLGSGWPGPNNATIASPITLTADSTLNFNGGYDTVTLSGNITGNYRLIVGGGSNPKKLTGANSYGMTTINSGALLQIGSAGTAGTLGLGNVTNNGALTFNRTDSLAVTNTITGTGTLTQAGTGTVNLLGTNTYSGSTTISAGTLTIGGSGTLGGGSYAGNIYNSGAFIYNSSAAQTLSGIITNSGPLTNSGTGTLTLSGVNTYTNTTMISNGKLVGVVGGNCSNSVVTLAAASGNAAVLGISIVNNTKQWACSGLIVNNAGTSSSLDFNYGSVAPSTTVVPFLVYGNVTFTTLPTITIDAAANSIASGTYPLMTWTGTGPSSVAGITLVLPHLAGNLSISGNTLNLVVTGSTQPIKWATATSGVWDINTTANWKDNAGTTTSYMESTLPGDQVLFDDTVGANTAVTLNVNVSPAIVTANTTNYIYAIAGTGGIIGTAGLTKNGTNTLTLATVNTYTGGTLINAGALQLGDGTVNNGSVAGTITNNATLKFANPNTQSYSGVISGTGAFSKTGGGYLTLSGANSYSGLTTVSAGILEVQNRSGDSTYSVGTNGLLKIGYNTGGGYANTAMTITGNGVSSTNGFYLLGGKTYDCNGQIQLLTAPTTIRQYGSGLAGLSVFDINGNGIWCSAAASGSAMDANIQMVSSGYGMSVTIDSGANNATGDLTLNGPVNCSAGGNTLGFYKRGAGSLLLNGPTTAGNIALQLQGGNVICGVTNTVGAAASVNISSGATFALNGFNQIVAAVTGSGSVIGGSATSAMLTITNKATDSYGGILGGSGANQNNFALTKTGPFTLTLSGANTFSGTTTISNGAVNLQNASALSTNTATVVSGAELELQGAISTTSLPLILNGTGTNNTGALRNITNNNTFNGAITLASAARINSDTNTLTLAGALNLGVNQPTFGGTDAVTVNGAIIGTGNPTLLKDGTGLLTLNNGAHYAGGLNVLAGSASFAYGWGNYTIAGNVFVAGGATLIFSGSHPYSYDQNNTTTVVGTLSVPGTDNQVPNLTLMGGTVSGSGSVRLANLFGTGGNLITIATNQTATISCPLNLYATGNLNIARGTATPDLLISGAIGQNGPQGIIKTNTGILLLNGANTYTGNTTISQGTLALGATGSISNSPTVSLAAGATFDVSAISAFTFTSSNKLSATGTASAATIYGASGGTVSLGSQPVTLTFDGTHPALTVSQGTLVLNGNAFTVNSGSPLALGSYNIVSASSAITSAGVYSVTGTAIPAGSVGVVSVSGNNVVLTIGVTTLSLISSATPSGYNDSLTFTTVVQTNGQTAGAATGYVLFETNSVIISSNSIVSGGTVSSDAISSLPRGTNLITAIYSGDANYQGSSAVLNQVVTNHPPTASVMTVTRTAGTRVHIFLTDVATNWSDVDIDPVTLAGVNLVTTNGMNVLTNSSQILYTNSANVADQISYTITDGQGGMTTGYINIVMAGAVTGTNSIANINIGGSTNTVTAYGIPGYSYILERATNLVPAIWVDVSTNSAATNGVINATDSFDDLGSVPPGSAYYRLKWQP